MTQKTLYANAIQNNETGRNELFSVKEIQRHTTKAGDPYYRVVLKDKTGMIQGRVWKDDFSLTNVENLITGDAVSVDFEAQSYNGQMQLIIHRMEKVTSYNVTELVNMSVKDQTEQWAKIQSYIDSFDDKELKELLNKLFSDEQIKTAYMNSPAAEFVHHDFIGGLMEHVLEMLSLAEALLPFYPRANRSMVMTGIILHDIGKIYELALDETTFIRTKPGYLLGHIMIGTTMIEKAFPADFDPEKKLLLEHIILSHHGEKEFGAVVEPATLEAVMVAFIDRTSDHIRQCDEELGDGSPDKLGFGKFHKYLKTKIYHGAPGTSPIQSE